MVQEWIDRIKTCNFYPEIFTLKDGSCMVALWGEKGMKPPMPVLTTFAGVEIDTVMNDTLAFALNYDAYVTNATACTSNHES